MAQCYCMHLKDPKLSRFNVEFNFNKSKGGEIYPFARYIGTTATTNGILLHGNIKCSSWNSLCPVTHLECSHHAISIKNGQY